jgi:AraC-like DNA-binding protein
MNMTVDDVASAAGISRRHLYDKFKKHLGRTVFEQINIARIARICDLLEKTDLSMLEIALKMGMGDDKHLYRYFRRYKGVTPYNWRRSRRL